MQTPFTTAERSQLLKLAFYFEGGLAGLALLLGWITDIQPLASLRLTGTAIGVGILGTIPLFFLFLLFFQYPVGALHPIKRMLIDVLGPLLSACRWHELLLLAALAGLSEEMLFRGFLQPWIELKAGAVASLFGSNLLFGLAHMVTPLYALLAGVIGVYLGLLFDAGEQRNLLTPVIIHGLYDYLAFLVVVRTFRTERNGSPEQ
jgi:CAAX protease family protein